LPRGSDLFFFLFLKIFYPISIMVEEGQTACPKFSSVKKGLKNITNVRNLSCKNAKHRGKNPNLKKVGRQNFEHP